MTTLVEKVLALSEALAAGGVPHAPRGAIALASCTEDPRGTRDVDVSAFVPAGSPRPVLDALPSGVAVPAGAAGVIAEDGLIRLWWDDTPVVDRVRDGLLALVGQDDPRVERWAGLTR